jgi:hypothetical protein
MLWAVLFGALLFEEPIDAMALLGIAIIMSAGILAWLGEKRGENPREIQYDRQSEAQAPFPSNRPTE